MNRPDPQPPAPPPPGHDIPEGLEADFAPLHPDGPPPEPGDDPYHHDSLQAQKAFDAAAEAAQRAARRKRPSAGS